MIAGYSLDFLAKVAFNLVNPIAVHSNLLGYGAELRHTLGCTLDNLIRTSDAELAPEFNQVFVSDVNGLSSESQIVGWIELVSRIETRECQVVCRCDVPSSTFLHHEGEITDVCINIGGKDVEYGSPERFLFLLVWDVESVDDGHQILVVPGIRIHGGKCLGVNLLAVLSVISLGQEMFVAINRNQFGWHHGDTCHCRQPIVHHLDAYSKMERFRLASHVSRPTSLPHMVTLMLLSMPYSFWFVGILPSQCIRRNWKFRENISNAIGKIDSLQQGYEIAKFNVV